MIPNNVEVTYNISRSSNCEKSEAEMLPLILLLYALLYVSQLNKEPHKSVKTVAAVKRAKGNGIDNLLL